MCIPWRKLSTRSLRHPKYGVQGIEIGWLALTNYRAHTQTQKALSKYSVDRLQTVYIKKDISVHTRTRFNDSFSAA